MDETDNRITRRRLLQLMTAGVAGLGLGCGGRREPSAASSGKLRLTMAHSLDPGGIIHEALEIFAEEVYRRSQGEMPVRVFDRSSAGLQMDVITDVSEGRYSLTRASGVQLESHNRLGGLFSVPFLFRNQEHFWSVLDGEIGRELLWRASPPGLLGLCYFYDGTRSFYAKRPLLHADDMKGLRVRVPSARTLDRVVRALGAESVRLPPNVTIQAFMDGRIDAAENSLYGYVEALHYNYAPYFSETNHLAVPDMLLVGRRLWEELNDRQRQVLQESAAYASRWQRERWNEREATHRQMLEQAAATVRVPDRESFFRAVEPNIEEWFAPEVLPWIERVRAVAAG